MRRIKGYRTIWFALFVVIVGVIISSSEIIQSYVDAWAFGVILICVGIVIAILRYLTDTPVGSRE